MIAQFDLIKMMLRKCHQEEIKSFKAHLKTFDSGEGTYRNKSVRLLEILTKKKDVSEKYAYSNLGYVLLGQLIEKVSGSSYEE